VVGKEYFQTQREELGKIEVPETYEQFNIIICKKENDFINTLADNTSIIGFIVAWAPTHAELRKRLISAREKINIVLASWALIEKSYFHVPV